MPDEIKEPKVQPKGAGGGAAFTPVLGSLGASLLSSAANVALAQGQRSHDVRMWNMQNEYNSPANQVKRLRAAGLNPGLNSSVGVGNNESSAGGQTAPTVDFSPIAQGVRDSVDLYQQKRMQDAQIDYQNQNTYNLAIRNRYENTRQILELDKLLSDKNLSDATRRFYEQERNRLIKENSWIDQRNSSMVALNDAQASQARAEEVKTQLVNDYQRVINFYAPKHQRLIMNNLMAEYSQMMSAVELNNANAANALAMEAVNKAEKILVDQQGESAKIDKNTKNRMASAIVAEAYAKAREAEAAAGIAQRGNRHGTLWPKFVGSSEDNNLERRYAKLKGKKLVPSYSSSSSGVR